MRFFLIKGSFWAASLAEAPAWGEGAVDESSRKITHPYPPQQPPAGVSLREENTSFSLWEAKPLAVIYQDKQQQVPFPIFAIG